MGSQYRFTCSECGAEVVNISPKKEGSLHGDGVCTGVWQRINGGMSEGWRGVELHPTDRDYWKKLSKAHADKTDVLKPDRSWVGAREFLAMLYDPHTALEWLDKSTVQAWDSSPSGEESVLVYVHAPHTKMLLDLYIGIRSALSWAN